MIVFRCFPATPGGDPRTEGGALWFPQPYQGQGRHDNPRRYGCLYVGERLAGVVAEQLQGFRSARRLATWMLRRDGLPMSLAAIDVPDDVEIVDLDEPRVLVRERMRPSEVATHHREETQRAAAGLHARHDAAGALRWWSTLESSWINLTLFDRVARRLRLREQRELTVFDPVVREAAAYLRLG